MKKICDLHTHTLFSDGTFTPTELVNHAVELGLSAVALCDHNTVDGISEFFEAAKNQPIEVVAGTEFSVEYEGGELHLLGLFLPPECYPQITAIMKEMDKIKKESNIALLEALNRAGYEISYEEVASRTPNGRFNRAHIGTVLTEKGYTESVRSAFKQVLDPEHGYYVPPRRLGVFETIDLIKSVGGVPVLAHPFLNLTEEGLLKFLPEAKKHGLVGMECMYSEYDREKTCRSLEIAKEFGLKLSGGSDFHGNTKPHIRLGSGKGNLEIPFEWYEALKP